MHPCGLLLGLYAWSHRLTALCHMLLTAPAKVRRSSPAFSGSCCFALSTGALTQTPPFTAGRSKPGCACVFAGCVLLNLGSLFTRWTNGRWKSTLHRVTNPERTRDRTHFRRRMSAAFFHKPNYDALIEVLPTCCTAPYSEPSPVPVSAHVGWPAGTPSMLCRGPAALQPARFPPVPASDLTRAGILHRYRHLPPDEASRRYHQDLAEMRCAGVPHVSG